MTKINIKNIFQTESINFTFKNKDTIFTNLKKNIKSDYKVLVAVSGGSDSILLSTLLRNFFLHNSLNTNNIYFIHLNHNTRKNNIKDEIFIKEFFKGTNLIIKTRKDKYTHKNKALNKTENNLRNRRYKEIKNISKKEKIDLILFGHNLTDRIESSFMNILRGCGLQGLQSMGIIQDHHLLNKPVFRPILNLSKDEVIELCKKYKISYIHDETNDNPQTSLRNFLRIKIFPQIYKLSNKKNKTTNSFIQSFQNIYNQLDEKKTDISLLKNIIKSPYRNCKFAYEIDIFKKLIKKEQLIDIIKKLGIYKNINNNFIEELHFFITNKDNRFKYLNNSYFRVSHSKIYVIGASQNFRTKTIDKKLTINKLGNISLGKLNIQINNKALIGCILRFPQAGDRFKNKTWNQYCISQKIPIFWRNFIPVVEKDGKIIDNFKNIYIL